MFRSWEKPIPGIELAISHYQKKRAPWALFFDILFEGRIELDGKIGYDLAAMFPD